MRAACLLGKHNWEPLQDIDAPEFSPEQCPGCGKTRIWNVRDDAWAYGSKRGLPEEVVARVAGERDSRAAPGDLDLPIDDELVYTTGGGRLVPAGLIVALASLPIWYAAPSWMPRFAVAVTLVLVGYGLAAARREIRAESNSRKLVHRIRLLPFTLYRRDVPSKHLNHIRVGWERNGRGRRRLPQFLVHAVGRDTNLRITSCLAPKTARGIALNVARALGLTVDDRTREPGAPGT